MHASDDEKFDHQRSSAPSTAKRASIFKNLPLAGPSLNEPSRFAYSYSLYLWNLFKRARFSSNSHISYPGDHRQLYNTNNIVWSWCNSNQCSGVTVPTLLRVLSKPSIPTAAQLLLCYGDSMTNSTTTPMGCIVSQYVYLLRRKIKSFIFMLRQAKRSCPKSMRNSRVNQSPTYTP